jgi:CRP/FNR family cyclic AMP-dependent transcriptional regulator
MSGLKALSETELLQIQADRLKNIQLFEGLSGPILNELVGLMKEISCPKNSLIISQGDKSRSLFIVIAGRLKVFAIDDDGNQTIFTFFNPNDYFGELSLLDGEPRSASVSAIEDSKVLKLDQTKLRDFIEKYPEVCWPLFKSLTSQIRKMDETICTLTSKDTYGRLIQVIRNESIEQQDGTMKTQKITHQELADMIGSSREMVSRLLKTLKQGGYIDIVSKEIHIRKKLPSHW